ncbi:MAG: nitroreductase family protein [Chlorobiales bacterium]|nr:nitroreductase family protein [Chlorobiales bacterium]
MKGESVLDFYDLVIKRCSIRSYERNRSIPEEVLNRILNAGRVAPSANNLQPWHFHVIRSTEILEKIYPCYKHDWIQSAPLKLEPNIEVFAFTPLGYAAQDSFPLPKKRKSLEEITSFF